MGRIRTIKPEFPQSETVGNLSRDARLLFIQLWTICDDSGRARASSRMLASLLYPYDDDAPSLIEGWLAELVSGECIRLYEVDGSHYLDIPNWLKHQKIDRPSKPLFPAFDEGSRVFVEGSCLDQGPRTKEGTKDQKRARGALVSDEVGTEFANEFWPDYPHKVGKPAALRAFRSARKKSPLGEIMAGLERYMQAKPPDRPWLNPATFLNQERWNDQPASHTASRKPNGADALLGALARRAEAHAGIEEREAGADGWPPADGRGTPEDRGPYLELVPVAGACNGRG